MELNVGLLTSATAIVLFAIAFLSHGHVGEQQHPGPTREVSMGELPADSIKALTALYGGPPGRFLRGQHGITHFHLESPGFQHDGGKGRIAVLAHGIGTNMRVFDGPIRQGLLAAGFRVLSYDFLGHGWSHADHTFMRYDNGMFLTQLEELLAHVLGPAEPLDLWVGHSTGGLLGVLAAKTGTRPIQQLALISPAFWANKPLIARAADQVPSLVHWLAARMPALKALPQDAYFENNDKAFANVGGAYLFPKQHAAAKQSIERMFELHPQVAGGILGISSFFLRGDLLAEWRTAFKDLVGTEERNTTSLVCLLWGKHDVVVPFEHATEVVAWASTPGRVSLVELNMGHESPAEDPTTLANEILKFTGATIALSA